MTPRVNRPHRKPGPKPGTVGFKPTDDQRKLVEALTGYGIPQEGIVQLIVNPATGKPISEQTLREHFRPELDRGTTVANSRVAGALFKNAVDNDNVTAQIFWLKTRGRWKGDREDEAPAPVTNVTVNSINLDIARRIAYTLHKGLPKKLPEPAP